MPTRSTDSAAPVTGENRETRKKYLALACACDRVELVLAWRKPARPANLLSGLVSSPWLQIAASALTPLLPRKLRAAAFMYRLWRSRS